MKMLVLNGPNINMLGTREKAIYGNQDYHDLVKMIDQKSEELGTDTSVFQSNSEEEIKDVLIKKEFDALIINLGAYTHYKEELGKIISKLNCPVVEVHMSNIYKREEFRHYSVVSNSAELVITGMGIFGYLLAMEYICR